MLFGKIKFFNFNAFIRITWGGMLTGLIFIVSAIRVTAQPVFPLNPSAIPNSIIIPEEETCIANSVTNVSRPTLTVFLPSKEKANRAAVNTLPSFLVHAADDIWISAINSIRFYEALRKNLVIAELHIYLKGSHGFITYPPLDEWINRCRNRMIVNKWIKD